MTSLVHVPKTYYATLYALVHFVQVPRRDIVQHTGIGALTINRALKGEKVISKKRYTELLSYAIDVTEELESLPRSIPKAYRDFAKARSRVLDYTIAQDEEMLETFADRPERTITATKQLTDAITYLRHILEEGPVDYLEIKKLMSVNHSPYYQTRAADILGVIKDVGFEPSRGKISIWRLP